uniref:Uncharacterized protein n=1 Tax=Amphimedon queenslandica TaxID=400682 RepID=A0A1X7ULG7_AMPQE
MAERDPLLTIEQDPQDDDKVESIEEVAHQPDSTENKIIDVSKIDTNAMKTFKELLQKENISIDITLLVIGRTGQGKQDKRSVNYAAQCFYNRKSDFQVQGSYYRFVFNSDSLSLDLTCFKDSHEFSGWMISPNDEEIPDTISLEKIDTAELNEGSAKVLKKAFPSISLNVYIFDETAAADEINESFKIGGTNLSINIKQHKEQP